MKLMGNILFVSSSVITWAMEEGAISLQLAKVRYSYHDAKSEDMG